mmetsp:Transcript_31827/g.80124  ORF Transcript_31827/g.80124 Transcript_31827/m.80124 type:complete len:224 (-) Transcript_31827:399-1070(-)
MPLIRPPGYRNFGVRGRVWVVVVVLCSLGCDERLRHQVQLAVHQLDLLLDLGRRLSEHVLRQGIQPVRHAHQLRTQRVDPSRPLDDLLQLRLELGAEPHVCDRCAHDWRVHHGFQHSCRGLNGRLALEPLVLRCVFVVVVVCSVFILGHLRYWHSRRRMNPIGKVQVDSKEAQNPSHGGVDSILQSVLGIPLKLVLVHGVGVHNDCEEDIKEKNEGGDGKRVV